MGYQTRQSSGDGVWALARKQHGVIARDQLLELGFHSQAIKHRVSKGRLHPVTRGVYAVGRPQLTREGKWMAAVLSCGPGAALSHESAAVLWGIRSRESRGLEVSVPSGAGRKRAGITIHRRNQLAVVDVTHHRGIPVTTPACTLIDLAPRLKRDHLEAMINEADKLDLIDPEALRAALAATPNRPGVATLRELLDRRTFRMTRSHLERRFLPIAAAAGLPVPLTGQPVNGYEVDFYWPALRLIVETDGLRYHRRASQQTRDTLRDQAHFGSGLIPIRFTHAQIRYDPAHVEQTLVDVAATCASAGTSREAARRAAPSRARPASTSPACTGT
jgi:very-short-patch-repair endonuclease